MINLQVDEPKYEQYPEKTYSDLLSVDGATINEIFKLSEFNKAKTGKLFKEELSFTKDQSFYKADYPNSLIVLTSKKGSQGKIISSVTIYDRNFFEESLKK